MGFFDSRMRQLKIKILVYGWFSLLAVVDAARILAVFPFPAKSHFWHHASLVRCLHDAGHRITFITPFYEDESLKNYTVIVSSKVDASTFVGRIPISTFRSVSVLKLMPLTRKHDESCCHDVLRLKEIQEILTSNVKKYDIMFVHMFYMHECYLPLAEKLDIPVIGVVTVRSWKISNPNILTNEYNPSIGNPSNPAVDRFVLMRSANAMQFWESAKNMLYHVYADLFHYFVVRPKVNEFYQRYYPAHLWHKKKVSLVFYNSHHTIFPRALVPNAIEIAGIHLKPANPLTRSIQTFIDEAEHGVILFTFGSVVTASSMNPAVLSAFKGAFAAIPQRVIWKYEGDVADLPDNVLTMKWVPQKDVLAHENIKAFISHCGISGMYEAISEGKPMVLIPLFADQITNAANMVELGVGVYLDVDSVTKEIVLQALNDVINDTRYRDRMQDLSRRFKDRPMTPQQSVVFWTEYVLRHKGTLHLRTVSADMPLYRYLLLDVILLMSAVFLVVIVVLYFILWKLFVYYFPKKKYRTNVATKKRC